MGVEWSAGDDGQLFIPVKESSRALMGQIAVARWRVVTVSSMRTKAESVHHHSFLRH